MFKELLLLILSFFVAKEPVPENKVIMPEEIYVVPIIKVTPTIIDKKIVLPTNRPEVWGVAKQLDEVTWTMKVADDKRMATPNEVVEALNAYRSRKGSQPLKWDNKLADLAQSRARYFASIKSTDKHEGFKKYMDDNGFEKLGFSWVGENSSYGYKLEGVHLIEWIFAGDKPHDDNQSDGKWDHVGVGIDGVGVDIIFGTGQFR